MSQAGPLSGSNSGPTVPTSFVTDVNSPAVPIANVLDVLGGVSSANNNNGIQTDGSSGSNVLTIQLTNTLLEAFSTSGAVTVNALVFQMAATETAYQFNFQCIGRDVGAGTAVGFNFDATAYTSGTVATVFTPIGIIQNSGAALAGVVLNVVANNVASANQVILQVTGVAAHNLSFFVKGTYIQI